MKKIRNYILKFFQISFLKLFKQYPWSGEMHLKDFLQKKISVKHISNKLGFIFAFKKKIGKYVIDSSLVNSHLCKLGKFYSTDKSPYNELLHRHPYTGLYSLIFSNLKDRNINFAEIGILNNSSIKMWRDFFPKANIYGFEFDTRLIENAKKDNLKNVLYKRINVKKNNSIDGAFKECRKKFDIIIDDSTHIFDDQIRIIKQTKKYLSPGGFLVIEDIRKNDENYTEINFSKYLKNELKYFNFCNFIDCNHMNKFSKGWDNDRILILVRNKLKIS